MASIGSEAMVSNEMGDLDGDSLVMHRSGRPGKIEIIATKPLVTQRDLALAYSPGVAAPCLEIAKDANTAYDYTARGNLVAVISNGTAVLGLGDIGGVASKPVMPPHIKMRHDPGRGRWLILAPERLFDPDDIAVEVLKLCDGARTVGDIAAQLSKDYNAPAEDIEADIIAMLQDLADKGVVKA